VLKHLAHQSPVQLAHANQPAAKAVHVNPLEVKASLANHFIINPSAIFSSLASQFPASH
jgi:hypothetical protein